VYKLEYIYTALLLHSTGKKISEGNVKKVLTASGAKVDDAKVKALVSSLEGVKIEEVIKKAAIPAAPVATAPAAKEEKAEEKKEKKPEDEAKKAEEAAGGLASLFG
jgi:large subunit ribosomal protein L12